MRSKSSGRLAIEVKCLLSNQILNALHAKWCSQHAGRAFGGQILNTLHAKRCSQHTGRAFGGESLSGLLALIMVHMLQE